MLFLLLPHSVLTLLVHHIHKQSAKALSCCWCCAPIGVLVVWRLPLLTQMFFKCVVNDVLCKAFCYPNARHLRVESLFEPCT